MKIGIFDSGLGGLVITREIRKLMPEYDYVYFGDTKRVPYGNKSYEAVYEFTKKAIDYLFRQENCAIIIIACNTASCRTLRKIQQKYLPNLPKNFKNNKVLGVIIPGAEVASNYKRIGVIATLGTVASNSWVMEIQKLNHRAKIFQNPAPMLVPLIENAENKLAKPFIVKYLKPLIDKKIDALVLGCTHYPILKREIRKLLPAKIKIISQEEIIPAKLKDYLKRHSEINKKLSHGKSIKILATDKTQNMDTLVKKWFGKSEKVVILDF